jgi:hypothetical protein
MVFIPGIPNKLIIPADHLSEYLSPQGSRGWEPFFATLRDNKESQGEFWRTHPGFSTLTSGHCLYSRTL